MSRPAALFGSDARLMFAPRITYRELLAEPWRPWMASRRPLLILLVIAASLGFAATRTLTLPLMAETMLWWSIVPLLQIGFAILLVLSAPRRAAGTLHAVDVLLAGHAPWSLWLLGAGAFFALHGGGKPWSAIAGSVVIVLAWRAVLLYHCCRIVLACERRAAMTRTVLHQLAAYAVLFAFVAWAIGLQARAA